jgi:hypothetical protein
LRAVAVGGSTETLSARFASTAGYTRQVFPAAKGDGDFDD